MQDGRRETGGRLVCCRVPAGSVPVFPQFGKTKARRFPAGLRVFGLDFAFAPPTHGGASAEAPFSAFSSAPAAFAAAGPHSLAFEADARRGEGCWGGGGRAPSPYYVVRAGRGAPGVAETAVQGGGASSPSPVPLPAAGGNRNRSG